MSGDFRDQLDQREWISWVPGHADSEQYVTDDVVIGSLVDLQEFPDNFNDGQLVRVYVLELQDDGRRVGVWANRTVLRNEIEKLKPQWGELIGIKYLGEQEPKGGGKPFHAYTVRVKRDIQDRVPIAYGDDVPVAAPVQETVPTVPTAAAAAPTPAEPRPPVAPDPVPTPQFPQQPPGDDDIPF